MTTQHERAEERPHLLVIATGWQVYREYLLRSISERFRIHLFHVAEPTWEKAYISGWTVVPSTIDGPAMADEALRKNYLERIEENRRTLALAREWLGEAR